MVGAFCLARTQGIVASIFAIQYGAGRLQGEVADFDGKPSAGNRRLAERMAEERSRRRMGAAGPGEGEEAAGAAGAAAAPAGAAAVGTTR